MLSDRAQSEISFLYDPDAELISTGQIQRDEIRRHSLTFLCSKADQNIVLERGASLWSSCGSEPVSPFRKLYVVFESSANAVVFVRKCVGRRTMKSPANAAVVKS